MVELTTTKEKTYLIADNWKDVNFGQYVDVLNIQQEKYKDLERSIKLISALSNNPEELEAELYDVDVDDFDALTEQMKWINNSIEDAAAKTDEKKFFLIDGKKFIIKKNYKKLTLGEMVSLEEILKDPQFNHQEAALGILIRELKEDGTEAPFDADFFYKVVTELKYKINLLDVYRYIGFFLNSAPKRTTKPLKGFSIRKV